MTSSSSKTFGRSSTKKVQPKGKFRMRLLRNKKFGARVEMAGAVIEFPNEKVAMKEVVAEPTTWEPIGY